MQRPILLFMALALVVSLSVLSRRGGTVAASSEGEGTAETTRSQQTDGPRLAIPRTEWPLDIEPGSPDGRPPSATATNSIGMEFVYVPAGAFTMGDLAVVTDRGPSHRVSLGAAFWLGRYEVTRAEYFEITGRPRVDLEGDERLAVDRVSWKDAVSFANELSNREGLPPCYDRQGDVIGGDPYACRGYRLPTEAEWEYAARAGTPAGWAYPFGDPNRLPDHAWYFDNAEGHSAAQPVGSRQPNPWGLYDLHGNVWEWVHDRYDRAYYANSPDLNPAGPESGWDRVIRGGRWLSHADGLKSAHRNYDDPSNRVAGGGFRLARSIR